MSDEPSSSEDAVPMARPIAPVAEPVGQARAIPWTAPAGTEPGAMYLLTATRRSVWADVGVFLAALVSCELALGAIAEVALAVAEELDERVLVTVAVLIRAAVLVAVIGWLLRSRGQSLASLALRRGALRFDLPLGLAAMVAAYTAHFLSVGILYVTWQAGLEGVARNADRIGEMLPRAHPVLLVAMQIVVGFYEELLFRGFLLTRLRRVLGRWWLAVLLSSALFAVLHVFSQEPVMAISIFGLGMVFSLFTIWRKSLLPAMIGHALFNSSQIMWLYYYYPDWT